MRVMTVLGSPRREGNTAQVLGWIEDRLRADGHQIDAANVLDYRVGGCRECMACKRAAVELCSIDDDANSLYRRMAAAELVLLAAPIFCWGFPAQLKGLVDRMYCMMDFGGPRAGVPRLSGRRMALLLTGGGDEADNAELVERGFERLVEYLGARAAGQLFIPGCSTPENMSDGVKDRAVEFAARLGEASRSE
jgi:multimeric flavodoxin WrbA